MEHQTTNPMYAYATFEMGNKRYGDNLIPPNAPKKVRRIIDIDVEARREARRRLFGYPSPQE